MTLSRNAAMQCAWGSIFRPSGTRSSSLTSTVIGPPVQRLDGNRTYLEVPLLRGDWLVVDNELRTVSVR
jgi:hypothetical protein